jgi:peroxiredoxin
MAVEIGKEAPDFELKDQHGNAVRLSARRGRNVAVVFYPFTFTSVCEGELCQLRDDLSEFEDAGTDVLAVSCDSPFSQRVWAEQKGYQFPVLSDFWPHGEVARTYGAFNEDIGCANRATFIIDKDGKVVDTFATDSLRTPRDPARYRDALKAL